MVRATLRSFICAGAGALAALSLEAGAAACAVCQSGSPATAAAMDSSRRFAATLDARAGSSRVSAWSIDERRLELGLSYDFPARVGADVGLPLLWRTVVHGGAAAETVSLGDLETRFRYLAWRRHSASLSLFFGTKWPTAPVATGASGAPLPSALQPGCSSIAPFAGAAAAWGEDGWVFSGIGQILLPFSVRDAPHPGDSVRLAATAERELARWIATRGAVALRLETGGSLGGDTPDPDSGGAVLYVMTDVVLRPQERVTGSIGVSFPVVQGWFGARRETPVLAASVTARF